MANVKDLLVNGSARVIGTIYGNATSANKLNTNAGSSSQPVYFSNGIPVAITGTISNNAATATKANQDSAGQQINTTYIKGLSVSGRTITYTKGDGTTGTITTQDNNTTYSAGTGLSLSGTTFNHKNSVTAGTAQGDANKTLTFGGTFTIPTVTYDAQGHITSKGTTTMTMPANPNVDTKVTQNAITASDYTNWRPLIWGASNSSTEGFTPSTVTDGVYTAQTLSVQPSSGTIRATTFKGNLSGNAATATKLATARTINGTSFNGSANITTANWGTARTLTIGGTGKSVNGSGNVSWTLAEIGAAAASHSHNYVVGSYTGNGGQQNPNYFGTNKVGFLMMNTTVNGNSHYKDWIIMDCYSGTDVGGGVALGVNRQQLGAYIMRSDAARTSWSEKAELLHTSNYTSYTVTKTGSGASGTWGINVTGSAGSVAWGNVTGKPSTFAPSSHNHDDRYYTESEMNTKLNAKLNTSLKGTANGLAELDASGKVPSSQLPSYVDDIIEGYLYNSKFYKESAHTTVITGETGKIYVDLSNNKTYRWSGSTYVVVSETLALGETSSTAYRGDRGKTAYDHSQSTHARTDATAVSFSRSLTSGTKVGTITINGTGTDLYAPTNTDTHWTTHLKVGASASATANAAASNGSVYLNVLDNSTVRDSHKIVGSGATTITSDANGVITISSTDNNTWRGIQNNLTSDSTTDSLSAAQGKALKALIDGKAASSHTHNYAGSSSAGGAANSANKLTTARTITLSGAVTGSASFDGSKNITINTSNSQQTLPYSSSTSQLFVTSTANQASYTLSNFVDNAVYHVYVNGFKIPNSEYTVSSSGVVTLTNPPELANQEVEIVANYTSYVTTDSSIYNSSYLNYYRQATAPSNTNALWLDTSTTTSSSSFTPKLYDGGKWNAIGGVDTATLDARYVKKSGDTMTGNLTAPKVYGAVWNDYAEYRKSDITEPGRVVIENGDGTLSLSTKRLQRGAEIISDTFGFAIGETDECKTPVAATGRVLTYTYESIEEYRSKIGWPVCSGPNGTISIMTEEEEEKYPSRIIGTISEVPDYEEWGTGKVKTNGRVWIRIK